MPTAFPVTIGDRTVKNWATARWEVLLAHMLADWWRCAQETFQWGHRRAWHHVFGPAYVTAVREHVRYVALRKPVQTVLDERAEVMLKVTAARKLGERLAEEQDHWQVDQPLDGDDVMST